MRIYNYANQAPRGKDIHELIAYLKDGAFTKKELAEATAYWIMINIEYDLENYQNNTLPPADWQTTYSTGKAVCAGYSELYKELCSRMGIRSEVVHGYIKRDGFGNNPVYTRPSHAWNVIELDGEFHLMDITWASGYLNMEKGRWKYIKISRSKFLFVAPEEFVEQHLPCQQRWQLLNRPISMEDFKQFKTFKKMSRSPAQYYNYQDSIAHYMDLSLVEQKIKNLHENILVHPNDTNIPFHYETIAYILAQNIEDEDELRKSRKFYQLAEKLHREPIDKFRCKRGIKYVDHYLVKAD